MWIVAEDGMLFREFIREQRDWMDKERDDSREFVREMTLRSERQANTLGKALDRQAGVLVDLQRAMAASLSDLQAEISDQRKQIQANTAAVLSVLDRLP